MAASTEITPTLLEQERRFTGHSKLVAMCYSRNALMCPEGTLSEIPENDDLIPLRSNLNIQMNRPGMAPLRIGFPRQARCVGSSYSVHPLFRPRAYPRVTPPLKKGEKSYLESDLIYEEVSEPGFLPTKPKEHENVTFTHRKPSRFRTGLHCTGCMESFAATLRLSFHEKVMSLLM